MTKIEGFPLYIQLKNALYERVLSCEWKAGQKLPSENELIQMYDVSRITVRQALSELQRDGVVVKQQGKGTFVNPQQAVQRRGSMYTFNRELQDMGLTTSTTLLDWRVTQANARLAGILQLPEGQAEILQLLRLRFSANKPFALEYTYLPMELVQGLTRASVENNGLYNSLGEQCNILPQEATETFTTVLLTGEQAGHLMAQEGAPAFHLQRVSSFREQVVEYCSCFIRGDRYRLKFNLK